MAKEDILLRSVINPPLATKGSIETLAELDGNFVEIYNALVALSNSPNVPIYNNAITYSLGEYVSYNNQLYRFISGTPEVNITPGTPAAALIWLAVYATDLVTPPQNDLVAFSKVITSAQVLNMSAAAGVPQEVIPALGAGKAPQIISASCQVLFDSAASPPSIPYATNVNVYLAPNTFDVASDARYFQAAKVLAGAADDYTFPFDPVVPIFDANISQLPANTPVMAYVGVDNPTAGDSDIIISGLYRLLTF